MTTQEHLHDYIASVSIKKCGSGHICVDTCACRCVHCTCMHMYVHVHSRMEQRNLPVRVDGVRKGPFCVMSNISWDFLTSLFDHGLQHRTIIVIRSSVSMTLEQSEGVCVCRFYV